MPDILIVGATGYTGKLITRYLAVHRERSSFSLGLAGRSSPKIKELIQNIGLPSDTNTYIVDSRDDNSVKQLLKTASPRVVIAAVGPYVLYGLPLARACAEAGIDYVDVSGEASFVYSLINELDFLATKTHSVLIPSCGFDSVPSDAIAFLSARTLTEALANKSSADVGVEESHTMFQLAQAGPSGGTLATMMAFISNSNSKKFMDYPDVLSPVPAPRTNKKLVYTFPPAARSNAVGGFFMLSPHNLAIVHRTRGLFGLQALNGGQSASEGHIVPSYAQNYAYSESEQAFSRLTAAISSLGFAFFISLVTIFPPVRWLIARAGPKQGEGPSDKVLEKGYFKARNVSVSNSVPGRNRPLVVESTLSGKGDPYALTAVFCAEAALALLGPRENLPALARTGGVLTPMTALGTNLIKRLSATGRFEFESTLQE